MLTGGKLMFVPWCKHLLLRPQHGKQENFHMYMIGALKPAITPSNKNIGAAEHSTTMCRDHDIKGATITIFPEQQDNNHIKQGPGPGVNKKSQWVTVAYPLDIRVGAAVQDQPRALIDRRKGHGSPWIGRLVDRCNTGY